jgi:hypothetical protein
MTYHTNLTFDGQLRFPSTRSWRETMINDAIGVALAGTVTATAGGWVWAAMWLIEMV